MPTSPNPVRGRLFRTPGRGREPPSFVDGAIEAHRRRPVGRSHGDTDRCAIGELIDGLDDVAALPIPYGRLPRRAYNAYSAEFASWSDTAGQTVSSLLSRPKVGEATVRALLAAATNAVAAYRAAATGSRVGP